MRPSEIIKYYSQRGFRDFLLGFSKGREVVPKLASGFSDRPQTFRFDGELISAIHAGATSFHSSIERWSNPDSLSTELSKEGLNDLRAGWDLIFDVDSKVFEYSRACARLVIEALEFHGIKGASIKFSGGSGFHVGVAFDSPKMINNEPINRLFPEAARIIGLYVQDLISDLLNDEILAIDSVDRVCERSGVSKDVVMEGGVFNALKVVNIDPIAISPRHLIRAPYSLNEKRWLVSLPISKEELINFSPDDALPSKVDFSKGFLDIVVNADKLFSNAFDWNVKNKQEVKRVDFKGVIPKSAVSVEFFPPCVKLLLNGLADGRKRSLFVLINFYLKCGYSLESVEGLISEWNLRNASPLRDSYVKSQIEWCFKQGGLMPPNCTGSLYKDLNVCFPDALCSKIKNPVNYALRRDFSRKKKRVSKAKNLKQ